MSLNDERPMGLARHRSLSRLLSEAPAFVVLLSAIAGLLGYSLATAAQPPVAEAGSSEASANNDAGNVESSSKSTSESNKPASADAQAAKSDARQYVTAEIRGRVVWLDDVLQRHFGIRTVDESKQRVLAIETKDGNIYPIAEDTRGHSFRLDPRLRVEGAFVVRRFHQSPVVQVVKIVEIRGKQAFELDYWCEICAIAMYRLKACDCCQGPIELRRRSVKLPSAASDSLKASSEPKLED